MNRGEPLEPSAHLDRHNGERGTCASLSALAPGYCLKHTQCRKTELLLGQSIQVNRCYAEWASRSETLK